MVTMTAMTVIFDDDTGDCGFDDEDSGVRNGMEMTWVLNGYRYGGLVKMMGCLGRVSLGLLVAGFLDL